MNKLDGEKPFRILIIDDNAIIHDDFRKILAPSLHTEIDALEISLFGQEPQKVQTSYEIDSAHQGREGLEKVQEALAIARPYALAFVDMRMPPGWDGLTTIEHLWRVDPALQVVICTAYAEYSWETMVDRLGQTDRLLILKKPFDAVEVRQLACALTVKWEVSRQAGLKMNQLEELAAIRTRELESQKEELRREVEQRKKLEEQLLQARKLDAIGRLAGGVAHEFNNILTVINGRSALLLERLRKQDPSNPNCRHAELIEKMGHRAEALTRQLLAFGRKQVSDPKILDLNAVVHEINEMLMRLLDESVQQKYELATDLWHVKLDPGHLEQVLMNLAINARDAMSGSGGMLTIKTENARIEKEAATAFMSIPVGEYVKLEVSDTGCGMDQNTLSHLFEPFFTTKAKGNGTGLGLSTIYGIVQQSHGQIDVVTAPGMGTTFKIYFPRAQEPLTKKSETTIRSRSELKHGSETVLLVEDEAAVRRLAAEWLDDLGYKVLEAANPEKALGICREFAGEIHLLLTDVIMPIQSGPELAALLKPVRPDMRVLFMSGYSDGVISQHNVLDPGINFIAKPFKVADLANKIREVLRHTSTTPAK